MLALGSHGRISTQKQEGANGEEREGSGQPEKRCGKTDARPMARALLDRDAMGIETRPSKLQALPPTTTR